ncbi:MAG: glutamate racemase [Pseudomonadota bacterium]
MFDSGVGGLTVAEALRSAAPALQVDYAADTGFFPYGDKSDAALRHRLPRVAKALFDHVQPDVFVIACNTASTLALDEVRAALPCPVVGTVPAIKPAIEISQTKTLGLLATPGTIRRRYTDDLIEQFAPQATVHKHGSLDLVELAEQVAAGMKPPLEAFAAAQQPLFDADPEGAMDVIVLACTHFPLVVEQLRKSAPRSLAYIDSGSAIARQTLRVLPTTRPLAAPSDGRAFVTGGDADYARLRAVFERFGFSHLEEIGVSRDLTSPEPATKAAGE